MLKSQSPQIRSQAREKGSLAAETQFRVFTLKWHNPQEN